MHEHVGRGTTPLAKEYLWFPTWGISRTYSSTTLRGCDGPTRPVLLWLCFASITHC